jgi:Asp-tRNA(Asn)/Glu-tRNA(Gln) amidotransferase B subunit
LYNIIQQITSQLTESEELITNDQFREISESVVKLEGLFNIMDHPYITKIFDRLLAQNVSTVKEQSKDKQVELNSKLSKLNKILKGSPISTYY